MASRRSKKGSMVIVDRKVLGKKRTPQLKIKVGKDLIVNYDCLDLGDFVSNRLAHHHADSYKQGRNPQGGPLPPLSEESKEKPRRGAFFNKSGEAIDKFTVKGAKGHSLKARFVIEAYAEPQWAWIYEKLARRGIFIMTVDGAARRVIEKAVSDWIAKYGVTDRPLNTDVSRVDRYIKDIARR